MRSILAENILYAEWQIHTATHEHLLELHNHAEWQRAVRTITVPLETCTSTGRYPGRTAAEYDALMASVISKTHRVHGATFRCYGHIAQPEEHKSCLPETLRIIGNALHVQSLTFTRVDRSNTASRIVGMLQAWPQTLAIREIHLHVAHLRHPARSMCTIDVNEYLQVWETLAIFVNMRTLCLMMYIDSQTSRNAVNNAQFPTGLSFPGLLDLTLAALYPIQDAAKPRNLVAQILRACPQLERLSIHVQDLAWMYASGGESHAVSLSHLRRLNLRCHDRELVDHAVSKTTLQTLARTNTMLATSPIEELEADSMEEMKILMSLMSTCKLSHLKQVLLSAPLYDPYDPCESEEDALVKERFYAECASRNLVVVVYHHEHECFASHCG